MNFQGLSSHADRNHLLSWIQAIQAPSPSTCSWSTGTGRWRPSPRPSRAWASPPTRPSTRRCTT
ncbi:MAG: hypothetical protein ACLTYN_16420 [Dysosmobacter welbionis]